MRKAISITCLILGLLFFLVPIIELLGGGNLFINTFIVPVKDMIMKELISSGTFPQSSAEAVQHFLSSLFMMQGAMMILCFTSYFVMLGLFCISLSANASSRRSIAPSTAETE